MCAAANYQSKIIKKNIRIKVRINLATICSIKVMLQAAITYIDILPFIPDTCSSYITESLHRKVNMTRQATDIYGCQLCLNKRFGIIDKFLLHLCTVIAYPF
jgi:hypothetical protein